MLTRWAAAGLFVYTLLAAILFHNNFADHEQWINFMKNVAIAGGFGETGEAGHALEMQLADLLRGSQTRLLGPNTLGLLVTENGLDTNFLPSERMRRPDAGNIAILSQSGSVAVGEMDSMALTGISISAFVGFGNRLDINENELMDYFDTDPGTAVLAMYLESFADPEGFLERCRRIVPHKPVILLKAGRSEAGARAVQLHTVETGLLRILGSLGIIGDHTRNLVEAQRARFLEVEAADRRMRAADPLGRRGRHRLLAVVEHRMDEAAHVPELRDDAPARGVDGVGHRLPALDLRLGPQAGRVRPAKAFLRDSGGFGDDQPRRGALAIIFAREFVGHETRAGAAARQRRHDDAVRRLDGAQFDRIEQRYGHGSSTSHFIRDGPIGRRYGPRSYGRRGAGTMVGSKRKSK